MSPVKSPQELSSRNIGKKDKLVVEKVTEEELPPGWKVELKTRKGKNGKKRDRYYTDPATGYIFRSLTDVQRYLKTGKLGRLAKKPKNPETEDVTASSPLSETPSNKRPLEDNKSIETSKSELPQRASKRLAGVTTEPPPLPPPSPPEPKTRKATRSSAIKTDSQPPDPKTRKATRVAGNRVEPPQPPPPPPTSPPEPKTSHQVTVTKSEEPQTRPPVVLAIPKGKDNDGNADVAVKPKVTQESVKKVNKDKAKADKNQESNTPAALPPVSHPIPPPAIVHEKQELPVNNLNQESSINYCLNDFWTDPCIEFAVKTLTGAIPFGDLDNKADNSSPLEVSMEDIWTDPCIEFAVKTLTGAIPVGEDLGIQDYLHQQPTSDHMGMTFCQTGNNNHNNNNKQLDSGGLQKSGNIGFHQQVNGSNGRPRYFQ